jgi:hypothetical protein
MGQRPLSVTIAGLLLIWWGLLGLWQIILISGVTGVIATHGLWSEVARGTTFLMGLVVLNTGIELMAGINILRGANWARMLWSLWCVAHLLLDSALSLDKKLTLTNLIVQFVVILVLFLPRANDYFVPPSASR